MLRVLVYIHEHLDDELDLERLASVASFSSFHFHRVFRGMVGEPVKGHVRRLRLERAAMRLKHGAQPVTQLAFDAGYETPESFSRAFRQRFGVSPSDYREAKSRVAPSGVYYSPENKVEHFTPIQMEDSMDARIESLASSLVAFVRHVGPYDQVGSAWQTIYAWAGRKGLLGPETKAFGLSYDDPEVTAPDKLRYDACIVVAPGTQPEGDVGVKEVQGWKYAVATHVGPYTGLGEAYGQLLGQWMPAEDLEPEAAQPCLEVYRNDPQTTPPEELRTDIYVPIKDGLAV